MRTVLLLSFFWGVIISSIVGYPPLYYVYLFHEILLGLVFLWFLFTVVIKKYSKRLEILTLSVLFFFLLVSPVNELLAPEYESHYDGDLIAHVDFLSKDVGERVYLSENERRAREYIRNVLEEKGFAPAVDENVLLIVEGKRKDSVIFCAHYDTSVGSPGADDNASGVSVLLELDIPENPEYTIVVVFFTGEETQLVESRYFAEKFDRKVVGVICVDTVGVGDDFHISSFRENRFNSFFLSQVVYGLSESAAPSIGPLYSDYVPFSRKGIEAVGLTRSVNRTYPHIHSDEDRFVDERKVKETGELVQRVLTHFAGSEHPYWFVYEGLVIAVVLAGVLAGGVSSAMDRVKVLKGLRAE